MCVYKTGDYGNLQLVKPESFIFVFSGKYIE